MKHLLDLLGGDNGHHPDATLLLGQVEVGADMIELAVIPAGAVRFGQTKQGNPVHLGEVTNQLAEAVAHRLEQRRGRNGVAPMLGQERGHLATHLEVRDIHVQVEPIDAGHVEVNMAIKNVVDVHHGRSHQATPVRTGSDRSRAITDDHSSTDTTHAFSGPRLASLMPRQATFAPSQPETLT
jgi:hypothetical protein